MTVLTAQGSCAKNTAKKEACLTQFYSLKLSYKFLMAKYHMID